MIQLYRRAFALLSVVSILAPSFAQAGAPVCEWSQIRVSSDDPDRLCHENAAALRQQFHSCVAESDLLKTGGREDLLISRAQVKALIVLDLFYLSRLAPSSVLFNQEWARFRSQWTKVIDSRPDLLKLDANAALGMDQCSLHQLLGRDCGGFVGVDMISLQQEMANAEARRRSEKRQFAGDLTYDLLEAVLLLESVKPDFASMLQGRAAMKKLRSFEKETRDYVFGFYPELAVNQTIYNRVQFLAVNTGLLTKVRDRVARAEASAGQEPLELKARIRAIQEEMRAEFTARPLAREMLTNVDRDFVAAYRVIQQKLFENIDQGSRDKAWLFGQSYVLRAALKNAVHWRMPEQAPLLQTMLCERELKDEQWENRKMKLELIGGGVALVTGVGAMLELGGLLGTACVVSTFGLLNGISVVGLYSSYHHMHERENAFMVNAIDYSKLEESTHEFAKEVPWAVVNVALMAPGLVIRHLKIARDLSLSLGETERAVQLERYRRNLRRLTIGSEEALDVREVYDGFDALKDVYYGTKAHEQKMHEEREKAGLTGEPELR